MRAISSFLGAVSLILAWTHGSASAEQFSRNAAQPAEIDRQAPPDPQTITTPDRQAAKNGVPASGGAGSEMTPDKRYPTADEVYYVMACMEVNGKDAAGLGKCSCAMNALEARLPYDRFKDAQIVVAARLAGGRNAAVFRDTAPMRAVMSDFTKAQRAANVECFGLAPKAEDTHQASNAAGK